MDALLFTAIVCGFIAIGLGAGAVFCISVYRVGRAAVRLYRGGSTREEHGVDDSID